MSSSNHIDAAGRPIRSLHKFATMKQWRKDESGKHSEAGPALETLLKKRTMHRRAMTPMADNGGFSTHALNVEDLDRIRRITTPAPGFQRESRLPGAVPRPSTVMSEALFPSRASLSRASVSGGLPRLPGFGELDRATPEPQQTLANRNSSVGGGALVLGHGNSARSSSLRHHSSLAVLSGEDRLQYFQWVESFARETQDFKSINIWADLVLCQVMDATKGRRLPCPLRTAVCCYVLDQLVRNRDRSGLPACLSIVKTELFNAVYADHQVDLSKNIHPKTADDAMIVAAAARGTGPVGLMTATDMDVSDFKMEDGRQQFQTLVGESGGVPPRSKGAEGTAGSPSKQPSAKNHQHQIKESPAFIDLRMFVSETERLRIQAHRLRSAGADESGGDHHRVGLGDANFQSLVHPGRLRPPHQVVAELAGAVKACQKFTKMVVFKAWRGTIVRKTPEDVAGMWLKMALQTHSKPVMSHFFRKWKQFPDTKRVNERSYRLQLIVDNLRREVMIKETTIENLTEQLRRRSIAGQRRSSMTPREGGVMAGLDDGVGMGSVGAGSSSSLPLSQALNSKVATPRDAAFHAELPAHAINSASSKDGESGTAVAQRTKPRGGSESSPFAKVDSIDPLEALRQWAIHLLSTSAHPEVTLKSLEVGLCDGTVFAALLGVIFPHSGVDQALQLTSPVKRAEEVLFLLKSEGLPEHYVQAADIVNGSIANTALLAWIFQRWYFANLHFFEEMEDLDLNRTITVVEEVARIFNIHSSASQAFHILSQRIEQGVQCILLAKLSEQSKGAGVGMGGGNPSPSGSGGVSDLTEFTCVSSSALSSVSESISTIHEIGECELILRQHYTPLKKIYEFYRGSQAPVLPVKSLWRFVLDTKLTSRAGITRHFIQTVLNIDDTADITPPVVVPSSQAGAVVRSVLKKNNSKGSLHGGTTPRRSSSVGALHGGTSPRNGATNPLQLQPTLQHQQQHSSFRWPLDVTLTKQRFVEILIQFAAIHVLSKGNPVSEKGIIAAALEELITVQILPRAMSNPKADFKKVCQDQKLLDVFAQPVLSKALTRVYRQHSSSDSTGKTAMTKKQFVNMVVQLQLLDRSMKEGDIESLFADVQDEDYGGSDEGGESMSLQEFQEALVALSMFKYPHPLQPVALKLQNFINLVLIPAGRVPAKKT